ncbi:MAG: hypothetical protein HY300_17410 [Verrucomicrobia bacterium]|nr:hypothetical protein [Verrucomicrobiota bacterium]
MTMAYVLTWVVCIIAAMLMFLAYWLAAAALSPNVVARAAAQYRRPVRLTLLGLLMVAPLALLAIGCLKTNHPVGAIFGIGLLAAPVIIGMIGSAGLCQRIGSGLGAPADDIQPWRRVLRGGTVLVLTFLLPVFGWIVLPVWTIVTGFAAAIHSFRAPKSDSAAAQTASVSTPASAIQPPPIIATQSAI